MTSLPCQCYLSRPRSGEDFRRRCREVASNTARCDMFSDGPHVIRVCRLHANMLRRRNGWTVGPMVIESLDRQAAKAGEG